MGSTEYSSHGRETHAGKCHSNNMKWQLLICLVYFLLCRFVPPEVHTRAHTHTHTHTNTKTLYLDAFIVHVSKSAELNRAPVQVTGDTHTHTAACLYSTYVVS